MRFDDDYDYEEGGGGLPIVYMALGVSAFVLAVLGIVIFTNRDNKKNNNYQALVAATTTEAVVEESNHSKLTADDLDIWDMYPENSGQDDMDVYSDDVVTPTVTVTPSPEISPETDDEKYNDGKHFKIELADGSEEWVTIDKKRTLNSYDMMNLKDNDGKLRYYSDGKATSFVGVDISRYQKEIDFPQVKNSGIDFVMIRVGARGYQTGQISLDEYFAANLKAASEAGLDIGVYFYSQAVTVQEATEEANLLIQSLQDSKHLIKYPVAFVMEAADNDVARTDKMTKDERTVIAATFLNAVMAQGYKTLLYGNEEWLVKKYDLSMLPTISIWLSDESDMPDYPYQFSMWQYTKQGQVVGINGDVNMDVCFIDYSAQ